MGWPESEMRETMAVFARSHESAYGPMVGSAVFVEAYLEPGFRKVTDKTGSEVIADLFAIMGKDAAISVGDLATDISGQNYEVIAVQELRPGGVISHKEVYLRSRV